MVFWDMPLLLMPFAISSNLLITAYALLRQPQLRKVWHKAFRSALSSMDLKKRSERPSIQSLVQVIRALSWSPIALASQRAVTRQIRPLKALP